MTPAEIDIAMVGWLPQSIASSIKERLYEGAFDPYRSYEIVGYDVIGTWTHDEQNAATEILLALSQPATIEFCAKELARLKVLTKAGRMADDDLAYQIAVMAEELARYPPDVVRAACNFHTSTSRWFPSWEELRSLCEQGVLKRRCLLNALSRYLR